MSSEINRCGCFCDQCFKYGKECAGCEAIKGRVFWAPFIGREVCPIYACCAGRELAHCGYCAELPCQLYADCRDPSLTDEQHAASVKTCVDCLREHVNRS